MLHPVLLCFFADIDSDWYCYVCSFVTFRGLESSNDIGKNIYEREELDLQEVVIAGQGIQREEIDFKEEIKLELRHGVNKEQAKERDEELEIQQGVIKLSYHAFKRANEACTSLFCSKAKNSENYRQSKIMRFFSSKVKKSEHDKKSKSVEDNASETAA